MSNKKTNVMNKKSNERRALEPQLRFPEFQGADAWSTEFGGDIFDQVSNKDHNSDLPVLAITQEHGAIPRNLIDYHVSVAETSIGGYKVVEVGDFIISLRSFQGGIEFSKYYGICSPAYVILRLKNGHSAEYFRHYLKTNRFIGQMTKNLEGLRDGKMISYKQFSELSLAIPPREEQERIADCLSSFDDLIVAENQKLDAINAHKEALMQDLFPREGEAIPRLRFKEYKNTDEWISTTVGQIAEFKSGGTPSKSNPAYWNGSIPWASAKDMKHLFLNDTEDHITTSATGNGAKQVPKGSVLILTRGMTLLRDIPICVANRPMSFNQDVKALQAVGDVDSIFMAYLLLSCKRRLLSLVDIAGHGTGRLDTEKLKSLDVMVPHQLAEQQSIVNCLLSLEEKIAAQIEKIDVLRVFKKSLMQQLFPLMSEEEV